MYAVIATGGKQYKVSEGDVIYVEKLDAEKDSEVTFDQVLAVGGEKMTIDTVLVKMSQLNRRKEMLDNMRKHQPKVRLNTSLYSQRKTAPEYQYINYDLEQVQKDYDVIDARIASLQLVLDKYNQTVEFDVDV